MAARDACVRPIAILALHRQPGAGSTVPTGAPAAPACAAAAHATVLPFRPAATSDIAALEERVDAALAAIDRRRMSAAGDLYDLMGRPLYTLALAITRNEAAAQEATVATFAEIWTTAGKRPPGPATAWVMEVACRRARAVPKPLAGSRRGRLSLVPTS